MRKYKVNHNFFKNINTIEASLAGYIAADGCIGKKENHIQFHLAEKDVNLLKDIKNIISAENPIGYSNRNTYSSCYLHIYSKTIVKHLKNNYNIGPNKTLTYCPRNLKSKKLDGAFIKGLIIGDGWITIKKSNKYHKNKPMLELGICGTKEVCEYVKSFRDLYFPSKRNYSANVRNRPGKNCYQYTVAGQSAKELLIYIDSLESLSLDRKFDKVYQFNNLGRLNDLKESH